jgi:hypothetical protein
MSTNSQGSPNAEELAGPRQKEAVRAVDEDIRIARHAVFNLKEFRAGRSTFPGEALGILEGALDRLAAVRFLPIEMAAQESQQTAAARDVLAERRRQIESENWAPEHDDKYHKGELLAAALCYMRAADITKPGIVPGSWPWPRAWWKPGMERRNLEKAGALILAEIERIDRAKVAPTLEDGTA